MGDFFSVFGAQSPWKTSPCMNQRQSQFVKYHLLTTEWNAGMNRKIHQSYYYPSISSFHLAITSAMYPIFAESDVGGVLGQSSPRCFSSSRSISLLVAFVSNFRITDGIWTTMLYSRSRGFRVEHHRGRSWCSDSPTCDAYWNAVT